MQALQHPRLQHPGSPSTRRTLSLSNITTTKTTETGLGSFATLPLAKDISGQRASVGVRYSSPAFTAGAVVQPATNSLSSLWLCGRQQGLTREWSVRGVLCVVNRRSLLHTC
jgi:hypothetical protein